MNPALHFHLTPIPPIRKRAAMELVVAGHADDHRLPTHGGHHLLPKRFARDLFQFSHMMSLKVALGRPAVFARLGIQSAYDFRAGQREGRDVWWYVDLSWFGLAEALEREDLQMPLRTLRGIGVDKVVPLAKPARDLGDGCPVLGRQRFEEARSPQIVELCQPAFGTVCQAVIVRKSPQLRIVGQDDFCVASLPPSWSVDRTAALIVAIAVLVATATQLLFWDAQPHPLGDGPAEGVGLPASLPDQLIRRAREHFVSQEARALFGMADGRLGFCQVQVQGYVQKVPDPGHDPAGLGLVADDANEESSSAGESPPRALTEPDVHLAAHPALIVQPPPAKAASARTAPAGDGLSAAASAPLGAGVPAGAWTSAAPIGPKSGPHAGTSATGPTCQTGCRR